MSIFVESMAKKAVSIYLGLLWLILFQLGFFNAYSQSQITSQEPNPGAIIFTNDVQLSWNSSVLETPQSTYAYQLATDTNLTNIVSQASSLTQLRDTVFNLSAGKYFWRVQLIENNQLIAESRIESFTLVDILNFTSYSHFYVSDSGLISDQNGRLFKWLNLADTSRSLNQSDTNFRPAIIQNSSLNALPAVDFDGVNDLMIDSSQISLGDLFVIANWNGPSNFQGFNGLVSGRSNYFVIVANGTSTSFLNSTPIFRVNHQNTREFAPLDQFKLINAFRPSSFSVPDFQLGRDRANAGRHWNGEVASVILTSNGLTEVERNQINQFLCQKYDRKLELGSDLISTYGFCDSVLMVDTNFTSYQWSNADTTASITLEMGGEYTLTVTSDFGCEYVDNIKYQELFSSPSDPVVCPGDTFTWDLGLSHNGYTFLWSDNSTDSLLRISQEGNYYVVVSDSNNCSLSSDTINVQIDSSLFQYDLGPDTSVCRGNVIELQNYDSSITQILWSTGNTSPIQIIDTAGQYTISFSNGSCQRSDTINVAIQGLAPTANFSFSQLCLGDSVSFIDSSIAPMGDSLISYSWDFDGLASDSNQNSFYTFPDTGNYLVELKVTTDKGCEDTTTRIVDIKPLPLVDFFVSGDCARRPLQFTNNSSISEGSLQGFLWDYGDGLQGTQQSPIRAYANSGVYNVKLVVTSDQNCADSTSNTILVNATPVNSFLFTGSCLGDSSRFVSTSTIDSGMISGFTWFVNQQVIEDSIANILFLSAGEREIIFRTESDSGCVELIRDTVEIYSPPVANFSAPDVCDGDSLRVIDSSLAQGDTIVSYFYQLSDGQNLQNSMLPNPTFELPALGAYQLKQIVTSSNGCLDSLIQTVNLNPIPTANFQILNNGSGVPMTVDVLNNSQLASSYEWRSGNGDSSNLFEPAFTYADTGTYQLSLVAISDENCTDTLMSDLLVLPSFLDAAILDAQILEGLTNDFRVRLQLENQGTNEIEQLLISVLPDGEQGLAEILDINLYSGQSVSQLLNTILVNQSPRPSFVCFEIETVNGVKDENPSNDRFCLSAFPEELYLRAYPNPFKEQLQIEFVLLENSTVDISLIDVSGREALSIANDQFFAEGYHNLFIPTEALSSGTYFLRFQLGGGSNQIKLIKP